MTRKDMARRAEIEEEIRQYKHDPNAYNPDERACELTDELIAAYKAGDRDKVWQLVGELVQVDKDQHEWAVSNLTRLEEMRRLGFKV